MKKMSKALKCHCYEEKYHFFFLNTKKKDRQKIYIIALNIYFILFFFLIIKKAKVRHLLDKKVEFVSCLLQDMYASIK
jgi:hypothetical protein